MTIAFFDSGIGGLSVLNECVKLMPSNRYIYYSDDKNIPYGRFDAQTIFDLTDKAINILDRFNPSLYVIACNTATGCAIDKLRQIYPQKQFVGVEPSVKLAAKQCNNVLSLVTTATSKQQRYKDLVNKCGANIITQDCPNLAAEIEKYFVADKTKLVECVKKVLAPHTDQFDALVLGCTHYVLVKDIFQQLLPDRKIYDGNQGVAKQVQIKCNKEKNQKKQIVFLSSANKNLKDIFSLLSSTK